MHFHLCFVGVQGVRECWDLTDFLKSTFISGLGTGRAIFRSQSEIPFYYLWFADAGKRGGLPHGSLGIRQSPLQSEISINLADSKSLLVLFLRYIFGKNFFGFWLFFLLVSDVSLKWFFYHVFRQYRKSKRNLQFLYWWTETGLL